jgi:Zn finger protein HypA/HybF involved in hydrogenase expression
MANPINKIPLKDILVENSTYASTQRLKNRLFKEGILEAICSECGLGTEWNGKPISLQLDHVNGINNDHRLSNLRILCPNCHSQTDTYAGKNAKKAKKVYKCKTCENTIHSRTVKHGSGTCNTCRGNSRRTVARPPVEQLKKEIDELGYEGTGRKYGVTGNAIRKWLKAMKAG